MNTLVPMKSIGCALLLTLMSWGSLSPAWAGAAAVTAGNPQCWKTEIDPQTGRTYANAEQWEADFQKLAAMTPPRPDIFSLLRAYRVSEAVIPATRKMKSDKTRHCYVGCRIAYAEDRESADFAGWYKEQEDLTDCLASTHFELADYKATQDGIDISDLSSEGIDNPQVAHQLCQTACTKRFGR